MRSDPTCPSCSWGIAWCSKSLKTRLHNSCHATALLCPNLKVSVSPPLSSSHGQGQDAVVVLNYKQQASDLAVGNRIAAILRSMFKDLIKGAPPLLGKEDSGLTSSMRGLVLQRHRYTAASSSRQRRPAQGKKGNEKTMSIPKSFRCHASSRHLEFSKMWLSGLPLHPYLVATATKFPHEDELA